MVVIVAVVATMASASTYNIAYADKGGEPNEKSGFGQSASEFLAQDGEMGDHSRAGGDAGDPPFDDDGKNGRSGIGNVRDALGLDHVSEIPETLCNLPGVPDDDERCNSDD